ncbi:Uncharacterised protein [Elizabethkingia miricola]|uniref:hypothetical protein n=1 Tax=Elizabethkingia miricola TaxID=172045 RepID=UPI000A617B40|nr:hypothetical protein [Elizabethkingia miricola]MCL1652942.1 hypothetical protein [Elizabethkingia miricola]SPW34219.1 Uncharacterised protein [Elizabethkingia miricola]
MAGVIFGYIFAIILGLVIGCTITYYVISISVKDALKKVEYYLDNISKQITEIKEEKR